MTKDERGEFAELLAATLEIYGAKLSPIALGIWTAAVGDYSLEQLRGALSAYVKTAGVGHFAPKPADLIELLAGNDGRPGAEEAWSTVPHGEQATAVWTEDAQQAFFAGACDVLERGDTIAARMAFKESYERIVREARANKRPCKWFISEGWDKNDRQVKVSEAVSLGRLSLESAKKALPLLEYDQQASTSLVPVP
jgi:hypothetical protein